MSFAREFEHRDRLVAAALHEFAEQGYDGASINRILEAATMSKGQFYHHFGGKEELYLALVEHVLARKRAHFEAHPVPDGADFFASLRAQIAAGLAFSRDNPDIDGFSRSFLRERGKPIFARVLARHTFGDDSALLQLVDRFYQGGSFHRALSIGFVREAVRMVFSRVTDLAELAQPEDIERRMDELLVFLRRGLGRDD